MSPKALVQIGLAAVLLATHLPLASAYSGGVIVPQVDPQPDDGYVDVWYHECPVTGSRECRHVYVTRITVPCADPDVGVTPGQDETVVWVENCGDRREAVIPTPPPPCVAPTVDRSESPWWMTPGYEEHRIRNCGEDVATVYRCQEIYGDYDWNYDGSHYYVVYDPLSQCNWLTYFCVHHDVGTTGTNQAHAKVGDCWTYVDETTPCVSPVARPDATGPVYGGTFGNCDQTTTVQTPCTSPSYDRHQSPWWQQPAYEEYRIKNCGQDVTTIYRCQELYRDHDWNYDGSHYYVVYDPLSQCNWWTYLCVYHDAEPQDGGRYHVRAGDCWTYVDETTPCADAAGTGATQVEDGVAYAVVVCGETLAGGVVPIPEGVDAPWVRVGSEPGVTLYVKVYPSCTHSPSSPTTPDCRSEPIYVPISTP